jgi:putative phosphoesterase
VKALVLSDTHIKTKEGLSVLREIIEPYLDEVDAIFHAGDSASMMVIDFLNELKPTYAVCGNMDDVQTSVYLPEKSIVDFGGFKIGITHGWGKASGIVERVFEYFYGSDINAIIFGHSHQPFIGEKSGILMLNPGSPTDKRFAEKNTIALLEAGEELTATIVELDIV